MITCKNKKSSFRLNILLIVILTFLIVAVFTPAFLFFKKKHVLVHTLEAKVEEVTGQMEGEYALLIKDLSFPHEEVAVNIHEKFAAASLIKVPILAAAMQAVREGKLSLQQMVVIQRDEVVGGSGVIKKRKFPVTLSFQELCEIMIMYSDNTAANKVIEMVGFEYINAFFNELQLKETVLQRKIMDFSQREQGVENYMSAYDIMLLLEKMYYGTLINQEASELMLSFLKKQQVNDRLPLYLPEDIVVAHKTGLERGVVHDAGIVFAPGGDYLICMLTKGVKEYTQAKKTIAEVSLLTYNLFQQYQ